MAAEAGVVASVSTRAVVLVVVVGAMVARRVLDGVTDVDMRGRLSQIDIVFVSSDEEDDILIADQLADELTGDVLMMDRIASPAKRARIGI